MKILTKQRVFEGELIRFSHASKMTNCEMTASIFLPPLAVSAADKQQVPTVYWLSGLTCDDQNFAQKAGAFRAAADLNLAIVMPDTSPRGYGVADDADGAYDFGLGAGFYVNATEAPYALHYQMASYVTIELPHIVESQFQVNSRKSISGHSMGGHGALTLGLKNPEKYQSISAFSPICNPVNCSWGQKAFGAYLGQNKEKWHQYDATHLLASRDIVLPIKVDQGSADEFIENQLQPQALVKAAQKSGASLEFNMHTGYDHSYHFVSTFIDQHLAFHAEHLIEIN